MSFPTLYTQAEWTVQVFEGGHEALTHTEDSLNNYLKHIEL